MRKAAEDHFTRSTQKEDETLSTKPTLLTVLNAVGTIAHCVTCILKRGRCVVLARVPLKLTMCSVFSTCSTS